MAPTIRRDARVTYQPRSPGKHRVEGESGDVMLIVLFTFLGLVFGGTGSVLVYRALAGILRQMRLTREGLTAQAQVVAIVPSRMTVNGMPQATIRYRYQDHIGRPHEGKTPMMPADEAETWREGDSGVVRFDRARPQVSTWVGKP